MTPAEIAATLLSWATANPEVSLTLLSILLGSGEAVRRYRRTGTVPLRTLPWRGIRRLVYTLRRRVFTTPKPPADLRAPLDDMTVDEIHDAVATQSYEPQWPLSYNYHGEDLNARRYYFDSDRAPPHRQLHIRAWDNGDGTVDVHAHEEPSAIHHPKAHLRGGDVHAATEWATERIRGNASALDPRGFQ